MKNNLREQKAITLVALIITIIVLLILAMVSIRLVMNGGIIGKAESGTQTYKEAEIQEQIKLAYNEWQTARWDGTAGDAKDFMKNRLKSTFNLQDNQISVDEESGTYTVTMTIDNKEKTYTFNAATGTTAKVKTIAEYPTATPGTATTENSKFVADGKTAVIPAGYTVSSVATEQSIDTGLVITKGGNEWVWIPVANVTDLYTQNTTNDEWILCGTSGANKVVSQYASRARTDVRSDLTRTTPGTTTDPYYREPDTVCERPSYMGGGPDYDAVQENRTAAGFTTLEDMATKLRDDYKNMIESVKKNGGFYVGRYELGGSVASPKVQYQQTVLTDTNWYNLYKACKNIDNAGVETRMIWGCQWDQVCNFIKTYKEGTETKTRDITNSTSYGNYSNSTVSGHGSKQVTGYSDSWKTNNIYDLAGNCWEWTQEANRTYDRACRGGFYGYGGGSDPVGSRNSDPPTSTDGGISSRPQLYVK